MTEEIESKEEAPKEVKVDQGFAGFEQDLGGVEIPEIIPVLPLRGVVVFPAAIVPLLISRGELPQSRRVSLGRRPDHWIDRAKISRTRKPRCRRLTRSWLCRTYPKNVEIPRRKRARSRSRVKKNSTNRVHPGATVSHSQDSTARRYSGVIGRARGQARSFGQSIFQIRFDDPLPFPTSFRSSS